MSGITTPVQALLVALVACSVAAATSSAVTIDPLTTAFPPNPNLPKTQPQLLFVGTYCDGASCPPDLNVTQVQDQALQTGVPGVLGGIRLSQLYLQSYGVLVQIDPTARRVSFMPDCCGEGTFELRYGQVGGNDSAGKLHANLIADGSTAFLFDISSSASPPSNIRFVSCVVRVTSHWGEPNELTSQWFESVVAAGTMRFDFSNFTGIDFTQVDALTFMFQDTLVQGIPFSIGPISTDGGATPARSTSWGRIKSIYR
jgi:hypothetical protein